MVKNIFLIRHGQSMANYWKDNNYANSENLPDHVIPLTELGLQQATDAGKKLACYFKENGIRIEESYMYHSSFKRTKQTAEAVKSVIGEPFRFRGDDRIVEQDFGNFDNIPEEKWLELFPIEAEQYFNKVAHKGRYYARFPNGESTLDVSIRVRSFIDSLYRKAEKHEVENFIVVSHGLTIRAFVKNLMYYEPEWVQEVGNPANCSIWHIHRRMGDFEDKGYL